jgi:hypothetical protein
LLPIIFIKSARRLNNQVFQANLGITIHADDDSDETLGHLVFLAQLKTNHPLRKYLIRLLTSKIPASPGARRGDVCELHPLNSIFIHFWAEKSRRLISGGVIEKSFLSRFLDEIKQA